MYLGLIKLSLGLYVFRSLGLAGLALWSLVM